MPQYGITLPKAIVEDALLCLSEYNWTGIVEFHRYNEPMTDPRLFMLIERAREALPNASVELVTNGYGLTVQMAKELAEVGVSRLHVSLYVPERERMVRAGWLANEVGAVIALSVGLHDFDDRLTIYDREPQGFHHSCGAPVREINVTCTGNVGLCCYDWRGTVSFSSLADHRLDWILASEAVQSAHDRLSKGDRCFEVCKRCRVSR